MTELTRTTIAALIVLLLTSVASIAESNPIKFDLPFELGQAAVKGNPMPGTFTQSAKFDFGVAEGFASTLASLVTPSGAAKLAIDKLFVEFNRLEGYRMNGLRLYFESLGFLARTESRTAIAANDLVAGSVTGSKAHKLTGLVPNGAAFASAEQATIEFGSVDGENPTVDQLNSHSIRNDQFYLRSTISGIKLAKELSEELFPSLAGQSTLGGSLIGDIGITSEVNGQSAQLSVALGIKVNGQLALRIGSQFELLSTDPFIHQVDSVIVVDGFNTEEAVKPSNGDPQARKLAELIADHLKALANDDRIATALATAAQEFAQNGQTAEVSFQMTAPANPLRDDSQTSIDTLAKLVLTIGLLQDSSRS